MDSIAENKENESLNRSHLHLPMQSQIALMFMAIMVMFAVFASLMNSLLITNSFEGELDKEINQYIQLIYNGYSENVLDLDDAGFRNNMNLILSDDYVLSVSLYDEDKSLILRLGQKGEIQEGVFEKREAPLLVNTFNDLRYYSYFIPAAGLGSHQNEGGLDIKENVQSDVNKRAGSKLGYIVLAADGRQVFQTALNAFVWTFFLTVLAAIFMMFIAVIVIRNFTKPFNRLLAAMENAQLGQRGVRVVPDGACEIYSMGKSFNSMISVLEKKEDGLLMQRKILEDEIKERKSAELELKNTTSRLQAIFKNSVEGIIVVNKDYEILSMNPSAESVYGYSEGKLLGKKFDNIMRSNFVRSIFNDCRDGVLSSGNERYQALALTKLGEEVPVEIGISLMKTSEEEDCLVTVKDMSERIKVEKELNNYQLHLEKMVKEQTKDIADARDAAMAGEKAMSAFLSNMSHELRTPMHGVLSFASIALKKIDSVSTTKTKEYLSEIKSSGEHLLYIINNLLDLSKMKSGKMVYHQSEGSLVDIAENVNREMEVLAHGKGIEFDFSIEGTEVCFYFDKKRIMQVIRNLYSNAIKFSHSNAVISITVDFRESGKVIFSVFNYGAFVPDSERDLIFNDFSESSETKSNAGGTGLGLPICKEIIESGHAGKIWSEPNIENGAKFIIELPLHAGSVNNLINNEVQQYSC